ncbi:MAG: D-glycero-beta-D-manno-heptose-7-phosphate kinase [Rikenellaceae bacterium]
MNIELNKIKDKRVLVVGDIMLDSYYIGDVKRISPEAPVPVVKVTDSYNKLGGAANVANNLLGLECKPYVVGAVGEDNNGQIIKDKLSELDIETIIETSPFPTVTKTRVVGNDQQVVRIDFESDKFFLTKEKESFIIASIKKIIDKIDIVIISDYNKGFCSDYICKEVIKTAKTAGKIIVVDPKGKSWDKYKDATIVTPNIKELADISEEEVSNDDSTIHSIAKKVIAKYNLTSLLVTRSEKGISYINPKLSLNIPTEAREVFDVSGAGDTVIATFSVAQAANFSISDSIFLANKAAGIVVGKMGTSPILYNELESQLMFQNSGDKIISIDKLKSLVKMYKLQNRKIIFTNGCFDILHKGHVTYLERAKALGDILIVGINSDSSVKRLKGENRPINNEDARATILAALSSVDYIVSFSSDTPFELIKEIKPSVLVKGGDYSTENIVGKEFAENTVTIPFIEGYSTTNILEKAVDK